MKKFYSLAILAVCAMVVFSCKNEGKGNKEIKDAAQDAVEAVEEAAQEAVDAISDAVEEVGEAAADAVDRAKVGLDKLGEILPYSAVEAKPSFNGGDANAFVKYVQENIKYPENALENDIEGKVTVNFVVDAKGNICNAKVVRGVDLSSIHTASDCSERPLSATVRPSSLLTLPGPIPIPLVIRVLPVRRSISSSPWVGTIPRIRIASGTSSTLVTIFNMEWMP